MSRVIVNVATGDFVRGQYRLARSLIDVGYNGGTAWWDSLPPGSPTHEQVPYAFKTHAMEVAGHRGYAVLLWVDASVWFVRSPDLVFDKIEKQGYYLAEVVDGHTLGRWCSDTALATFGVGRDAAMSVPLVYGGFYGYDLRSKVGLEFAGRMHARTRDGSMRGEWTNDGGRMSSDPRVSGHRHDQSVLSALAHEMGLPVDKVPSMFVMDAHEPRTEKTVAVCRGLV